MFKKVITMRTQLPPTPLARAGLLAGALALSASAATASWYPVTVDVWEPAFDMNSPRTQVDYAPLESAEQAWDLCVSFPHMKDAYWLAVNYGVIAEAERLGVNARIVEAGGYTELNTQISQIEDCVAGGADAVIIGAISADGLNNVVSEVRAEGIPVIDVINGISSPELSAKSLVSFGEMGFRAGQYLAEKHPAGSETVRVAWFPGPSGAGWVEAGNVGFQNGIEGSAIEIVDTRYGDTGKEAQLSLVEDAVEANPEVDYIVGTAVTAEAATGYLRSRGLDEQIDIMSYYFTPGVYRGIRRGQILGAPTDSTVLQGRIAVDQAVRILEEKEFLPHVGPQLYIVDSENVGNFDRDAALAPDGFRPQFSTD